MRGATLALLVWAATASAATLEFRRDGTVVARLDDAALAQACAPRTITLDDPYYEAEKRYRACPLATVFAAGFGAPPDRLGTADVVFRARDGYVKTTTLARMEEDGGFLALGEDGRDGFAAFGRRHVDPGPFYVVWTKTAQHDTHRYPWPYQLAAIELTSLATKLPHTVPDGLATDDPGWHGYAIFRSDCIACHSINTEGGTVGPELNVPRSILEYWPADQVKAFVRNPASFRYGKMPAHEYLTDGDLDALIAYFRAMQARKHDPGRRP